MTGWVATHRRWSKDEIDSLYEAVEADIPWTVVATRLGRSYKAVTRAAYERGLRRRERAKTGSAAQTAP